MAEQKKIFHTNAKTDTLQIAARRESLPRCIQLGNAEAAHSARFLARVLKVQRHHLEIRVISYPC